MTDPAQRVSPGAALDRTKLLAARFRAANDRPYLATALFSMTVVASDEVPTMAVDRHWRCYVSPAFVARLPVEQLAAVWVHEVAHLLRDHHGRADLLSASQRDDHRRVNVAQDCEINDDLLAERMPLPDGRVDPMSMGLPMGLLFEQYLPMLPPSGHTANCGSGAHGRAEPWELGVATGTATVRPVEADAIRRQTAQGIRSHLRSRGTVPGGWQRWADQVLEPTVDWRQVLTGLVREAAAWASGAVDYTYHRPSRRSGALRGVVLPSLRQPLPRVAIVVDTSGSMGDDALAAVLGEVTGVLRAVGIRGNRVTVIACDADVHATRRVTSVQDVVLAGGGGTDMRVGIDAALRAAEPPHFVVVLTDGLTPWPETPLDRTRVIAGLVGVDAPQPPDWIAVVRIPLA
ncbi:VWA-like domain-containing protein [Micromonospora polyrhachis]|uniref:Putative metal-dependent peptidase n=1 Tax=Micromonospora polyrhachis TaxID=1282883 RepID=A0A7W7SXJ9_9ACTN|nr:VWA-like domain-containing protein [Micromonospora polyrhachis]MBB4962456.1 putative metal-dependent peptidase [Micromonospora polyrhachis]